MNTSGVRMNGGFFVMRPRSSMDRDRRGLVEETFEKLIPRGEVGTYRHDGFFGPMDTIKDRQWLEELLESGQAPWLRLARPRRDPGRVMLGLPDGPRARAAPARHRRALDDLEIGCAGHDRRPRRGESGLTVHWVVLAAPPGGRGDEARASAEALLAQADESTIDIHAFRDGICRTRPPR